MSFFKKPLFLVFVFILILGGAGAGLYFTGNLPIGPGQGGNEALADTEEGQTDSQKEEGDDDKPEVMPVPVELALAKAHGISSYYRAASVIEADRMVDLTCRTSGRVQSILVEEGDWVEKGAPLAELENDREKIQLRKADLTTEDKKRLLDRNKEMLAGELISQQEFQDVESAWKMALAERDLARIALEETFIRAPFAGRITDRKIVIGQQVAISAPTFTLGDFDPLRVRVNLPEAVARKVSAGQRVLVSPEAMNEDLEAKVERVSPVVDPATSTVRLTLLLEDAGELAQVGGFAKIRITTDSHHDALSIPKLALVEEGALRSVFVAVADTVRKVEIRTGLYDETHVEILEGLNDGDFIVTMGQGGLRTGTLIKALNGEGLGYESPSAEPSDEPDTVTAMVENN
jgi:membrane fusion protein, multidrug efflux system